MLRTLADDVTKDLQLAEQIITGQTEVRAQAVVAAVLPFVVLAMLVSSNDGFRAFYRTTAGFVVICIGAAMAFVGWKLINAIGRLPEEPRVLTPPTRSARVSGQVLAIAAARRRSPPAAWCGRSCAPRCGSGRAWPRTPTGPGAGSAPPCRERATGVEVGVGADGDGRRRPAGRRVGHRHHRRARAAAAPAGLSDVTVAGYRRRQLAYAVAGFVFGVAMASLLAPSTALSLIVIALLRLDRACSAGGPRSTGDRRPPHLDAGRGAHRVPDARRVAAHRGHHLHGALDRLTQRATGIVPGELAEAAAQIRSGSPPVEVLERLATQTAEPSAARLYRLYGASWSAGGDPAALLALSDSLRASRRDAPRPHDGQPPHRHGPAAGRRDRPDPDPVHRRRHPLDRVRLTHHPERNRP